MATADLKSKRKPPARPIASPDEEDRTYCVVIPPGATTLAGFRKWSYSDTFPERGKITFVGGEILIDMSPECLNSHNAVIVELARVLGDLVVEHDLGQLYINRARFAHVAAEVSNEPDLMFVGWQVLEEKRVRLIPTKDEKDYIEFEGTPDLVVEIISPSSVTKDTVKLFDRYHRAGVPEYWLIDARKEPVSFQLLVHEPAGYCPARGRAGWQKSRVLGKQFRPRRTGSRLGHDLFLLDYN